MEDQQRKSVAEMIAWHDERAEQYEQAQSKKDGYPGEKYQCQNAVMHRQTAAALRLIAQWADIFMQIEAVLDVGQELGDRLGIRAGENIIKALPGIMRRHAEMVERLEYTCNDARMRAERESGAIAAGFKLLADTIALMLTHPLTTPPASEGGE